MVDKALDVTAWVLSGGEGRRMGGADKGLMTYQGQRLADRVLRHMALHVSTVNIIANRHLPDYSRMLAGVHADHTVTGQALVDDPDLPAHSGPMAGIITALRHTTTPWLWVNPCDTLQLPKDLLNCMMRKAIGGDLDVVVAATPENPSEWRHHWLCCLINKRVCPHTEAAFVTGERKIGRLVQSLQWQAVCFPDPQAFMNINTPETHHGRD